MWLLFIFVGNGWAGVTEQPQVRMMPKAQCEAVIEALSGTEKVEVMCIGPDGEIIRTWN